MPKNTALIAVMLLATVGMVAPSIGATEDSNKQVLSEATKQEMLRTMWLASAIALVDISHTISCTKEAMPTGETIISNPADCVASMKEIDAIFARMRASEAALAKQDNSQYNEVSQHIEHLIKSI